MLSWDLNIKVSWKHFNRICTLPKMTYVVMWPVHPRAAPILYLHLWFDSDISALHISRYPSQSDISTLRIIHAFMIFFVSRLAAVTLWRCSRRHYPFLAGLRRARSVIVRQLEVVIQACHVFPFPLPADFQAIQLVCTRVRGHTVSIRTASTRTERHSSSLPLF